MTNITELKQKRDIPGLIAALKDSRMCQLAARTLGEIGDGRAVEPLITILKEDGDSDVRQSAAGALVQIGEPSVEPLIATLKEKDDNAREAAAQALGQIGNVCATEPLTIVLKDENWKVRQAAVEALGRIGDIRAVDPLIVVLEDEFNSVRKAAAEALDRLSWKPKTDRINSLYLIAKHEWDRCVQIGAPAVEPLIALLKNRDPWVRRSAAKALGEIRDPRAVEPLVTALREGEAFMSPLIRALECFDTPQARVALEKVENAFKGTKTLVYVEDEPEMVDLVKLVLDRAGFKLVGAIGGREGLDTVRKLKPDLIMLDLMMPDMDGWEVYQQMKADEELKDIPVVVVTAKAQSIAKVLGLHIAKVDDYVTKPFGPQELLQSINKVLIGREWE